MFASRGMVSRPVDGLIDWSKACGCGLTMLQSADNESVSKAE